MSATRKRIDWEEVKNRLAQSQGALDRTLSGNDDDLPALFRKRAAQLAGRQNQGAAAATALRVLVFGLGAERYALDFADLVELLPFVNCTPVPGGPAELLGVINVHGEIRSVVDLGRLLELPDREACTGGYVLLVRNHGRAAGVRVDRIDRLEWLAPENVAAPAGAEAGTALRYLRGLTADRIRLLDTAAVLAHPVYQA